MALFYGYRKLNGPEDWKGLAGDDKWVATRSAYELAFSWHGSGGLPPAIAAALDGSGHPVLQGLRLEVGFIEKPVFLDTLVGPSMTDLMGLARNRAGEQVVIAVEGKADEPFGLPIQAWLKGDRLEPQMDAAIRYSRLRRLKFLCERLRLDPDPESSLHYQLLHRTVSGVLDGQLNGASAVLILIHSFAALPLDNWVAYLEYLRAVGVSEGEKGRAEGPVFLGVDPGVPTYFLWWEDAPKAQPHPALEKSSDS